MPSSPTNLSQKKTKGYKDNRIKTLNQDIINQDKWGEAQIKARAKNLANMALGIWTEPKTPLQTITAYTIERHFADKNSRRLYEELKAQITQLAQLEQLGEVSEKINKHTIAPKIDQKEVLSIVPWKDYLNIFFYADISKLDDPKGKVEDMTRKGHWGNGNTKIKLESPEEIPYCIDLIKQALAQKEILK